MRDVVPRRPSIFAPVCRVRDQGDWSPPHADRDPDHPPLRDRFLDGMASAACTVHVVTTEGPSGGFGVTVSVRSSVSADGERPTLLVGIHHASAPAGAILANGVLWVNVLRADQAAQSGPGAALLDANRGHNRLAASPGGAAA